MTQSNPPIEQILPPKRGRFRVLKALALSAVIFLAGGAAGYGVSWLWHPPFPPPPMGRFDPDPPVGSLVDRLRIELSLSDDQAKHVRQIYQDCRDGLMKIREQVRPQFKAQFDKLDAQMNGAECGPVPAVERAFPQYPGPDAPPAPRRSRRPRRSRPVGWTRRPRWIRPARSPARRGRPRTRRTAR